MSSLFVESPIHYGGVVTFETVANVRDVYEVRAALTLTNGVVAGGGDHCSPTSATLKLYPVGKSFFFSENVLSKVQTLGRKIKPPFGRIQGQY